MQVHKSRPDKATQSRAIANQVQRKTDREIVDPLTQLKLLSRGKFQAGETAQLAEGAGVQQRVAAPTPNRTGMPDRLKSGIEGLSGFDMSDVRVHYNSDKPAQLQAHAYAQGNQIYLGPGQERHLPHEAWHVVQQKQGKIETRQPRKLQSCAKRGELNCQSASLQIPIYQKQALSREAIQRMSIRGVSVSSEWKTSKKTKHVVDINDQETKAKENYQDSTFTIPENVVPNIVDGNSKNFTELANARSTRFLFDADVPIYQWEKQTLGINNPVTKILTGDSHSCEIGVTKTGEDKLQIDHFQKN